MPALQTVNDSKIAIVPSFASPGPRPGAADSSGSVAPRKRRLSQALGAPRRRPRQAPEKTWREERSRLVGSAVRRLKSAGRSRIVPADAPGSRPCMGGKEEGPRSIGVTPRGPGRTHRRSRSGAGHRAGRNAPEPARSRHRSQHGHARRAPGREAAALS